MNIKGGEVQQGRKFRKFRKKRLRKEQERESGNREIFLRVFSP